MKYITLSLMFLANLVNAQNQKHLSLKLYSQLNLVTGSQVTLNPSGSSSTYSFSNSRLRLSPGISWGSKSKYSHEIVLNKVNFKDVDEKTVYQSDGEPEIITYGLNRNEFDLGLRYEFARRIGIFKQDSKLDFNLGLALSPSVSVIKLTPVISNSFPVRETSISVDVLVVPRLTYAISKEWFVDLNTPVYGANVQFETSVIEYANREQKTSKHSQGLLPANYEIRLGIGYNLH